MIPYTKTKAFIISFEVLSTAESILRIYLIILCLKYLQPIPYFLNGGCHFCPCLSQYDSDSFQRT